MVRFGQKLCQRGYGFTDAVLAGAYHFGGSAPRVFRLENNSYLERCTVWYICKRLLAIYQLHWLALYQKLFVHCVTACIIVWIAQFCLWPCWMNVSVIMELVIKVYCTGRWAHINVKLLDYRRGCPQRTGFIRYCDIINDWFLNENIFWYNHTSLLQRIGLTYLHNSYFIACVMVLMVKPKTWMTQINKSSSQEPFCRT